MAPPIKGTAGVRYQRHVPGGRGAGMLVLWSSGISVRGTSRPSQANNAGGAGAVSFFVPVL